MPLVFGLYCSGHPQRLETVRGLVRTYGLFAKARTSQHSSLFRSLTRSVMGLLEGRHNKNTFLESLPRELCH